MTLELNKELAKRAVVLLRASSKQQTDREHDFDIPQQKSILLPFVEPKGWDLVKVFTEGGVSGFKVSANDRDAMNIPPQTVHHHRANCARKPHRLSMLTA